MTSQTNILLQLDDVDRENIICHGAFTPDESAKMKIVEESDHTDAFGQHHSVNRSPVEGTEHGDNVDSTMNIESEHVDSEKVSNIGVNDVIEDKMDVSDALGQQNSGSRDAVEGTKHCDHVDSIIRDVVSTIATPTASLPTTPAVKYFQVEQSCDERPNDFLDIVLWELKTYSRKEKCTTPVVPLNVLSEDDELSKTKITEVGLSAAEVKDVTPEKSVRQKFTGKLVKSPYVTEFDSEASKCIFSIKHPFTCDIDNFDSMSPLAEEFRAFISDGLNKRKRAKNVYLEGQNCLPGSLYLARVL